MFDAPRDLVWKAHSELEGLKHWWGPKGFTWVTGTLDFRPGGMFHYGMRSPNGQEMWGRFVYREIVKPERIVSVSSFSDREWRPHAPSLEPGLAAGNAEHGDPH